MSLWFLLLFFQETVKNYKQYKVMHLLVLFARTLTASFLYSTSAQENTADSDCQSENLLLKKCRKTEAAAELTLHKVKATGGLKCLPYFTNTNPNGAYMCTK